MGALAVALVLAFAPAGGGQPLLRAVSLAYGVPTHRILAPDWFREARFEIPPGISGPALRKELEERYSLNAGFQDRAVETWVLECPEPRKLTAAPATGITSGPGSVRGAASLEALARVLGGSLGADVADETGVSGAFRFSVSWPARDADAMVRAFREGGLELRREYREAKFLVVYSAFWPDAPQPLRHPCGAAVLRHRDDPAGAAYLEARSPGTEPARALALLRAALREEPDFPHARLLAAALAEPGAGREAHLRRFRELCPASIEDAPLYGDVRDPDLLRSAVAAFTRALLNRTDPEALAALPHYWRLRRHAGPHWPPNWLELEVARIRQLNRAEDPLWHAALNAGRELLKPPAAPAAPVPPGSGSSPGGNPQAAESARGSRPGTTPPAGRTSSPAPPPE